MRLCPIRRVAKLALPWGAAAVLMALGEAGARDLATCNESVGPGEVATLVADLDCPSGAVGAALAEGSTLDLAGHTLSGGTGVVCIGSCTIRGPGGISGSRSAGISVGLVVGAPPDPVRRMVVQDLDVHDHDGWGIGAVGVRRLELVRVTVRSNRDGVVVTGRAGGRSRVRGQNVDISGNIGTGLFADHFSFDRLTLRSNGGPGIVSNFSGRLRYGEVTSNNADDPGGALDIVTRLRPRLIRSTCGQSAVLQDGTLPAPGAPGWGICADDR